MAEPEVGYSYFQCPVHPDQQRKPGPDRFGVVRLPQGKDKCMVGVWWCTKCGNANPSFYQDDEGGLRHNTDCNGQLKGWRTCNRTLEPRYWFNI
ncbi:MAG: hypothetical protein HYW33_03335 [Candidatus Blackburnbacteria bacterium]|nr:hypothetical protein [Candidatus Blackburnbacteria bacterium]